MIAEYAARYLAPGIAATRSYRTGGELSIRPVEDLRAAVREAVRDAPLNGTTALIAADGGLPDIEKNVKGPEVAVLPASLIKGLEFDNVIVAEPADIVVAEPRG